MESNELLPPSLKRPRTECYGGDFESSVCSAMELVDGFEASIKSVLDLLDSVAKSKEAREKTLAETAKLSESMQAKYRSRVGECTRASETIVYIRAKLSKMTRYADVLCEAPKGLLPVEIENPAALFEANVSYYTKNHRVRSFLKAAVGVDAEGYPVESPGMTGTLTIGNAVCHFSPPEIAALYAQTVCPTTTFACLSTNVQNMIARTIAKFTDESALDELKTKYGPATYYYKLKTAEMLAWFLPYDSEPAVVCDSAWNDSALATSVDPASVKSVLDSLRKRSKPVHPKFIPLRYEKMAEFVQALKDGTPLSSINILRRESHVLASSPWHVDIDKIAADPLYLEEVVRYCRSIDKERIVESVPCVYQWTMKKVCLDVRDLTDAEMDGLYRTIKMYPDIKRVTPGERKVVQDALAEGGYLYRMKVHESLNFKRMYPGGLEHGTQHLTCGVIRTILDEFADDDELKILPLPYPPCELLQIPCAKVNEELSELMSK